MMEDVDKFSNIGFHMETALYRWTVGRVDLSIYAVINKNLGRLLGFNMCRYFF